MLLNIPGDILVELLHILEVQDILLVESTCRSLRHCIMHDFRHLWLTKLNELDPSCAPDMPHNISVESLTSEELRNIVVKAVRQYCAVMKSSPSKPMFSLRNRIPLDIPDAHLVNLFRCRIIPGGRYLFIYWTAYSSSSWCEKLYIVDTKDSNRRVWTYEHGKNQDGESVLDSFDFKARRDGTIILVALYHVVGLDVNVNGFFRVFELSLESESGTFRQTLVYSMPCSNPFRLNLDAQTRNPVSDNVVILLDPGINLILALKWDDKKVARIRSTRLTALRCFRIWQDHLFYIDTKRQELRAIWLSQLFDLHPNDGSSVELDHLPCAILNIHGLRDQNRNQSASISPERIMYSIYDTPWKKDSTAVFTITLQTSTRDLVSTSIRARFSSDDTVNWRWTVLSVRTAGDSNTSANQILFLPDMTRSGRTFFAVLGEQKFGIRAVNRQGDPVIAFQPVEINQLLQESDNEHGQSPNGFEETSIKTGFDEYWGSLCILQRTPSVEYILETYYPV